MSGIMDSVFADAGINLCLMSAFLVKASTDTAVSTLRRHDNYVIL